MANIKFTEIPAWAYVGKEPSKYTFFESIALLGLEGVEIRLNAATQKKLLGANVFGSRAIKVGEDGTVDCTISCAFGRDFESATYSADTIQQAAKANKQLRPGWSGVSYYVEHVIQQERPAPELLGQSYQAAVKIASDKGVAVVPLVVPDQKKEFGGKVLGITEYHVLQNTGKSAVIHKKSSLDRVPEDGEIVNITYNGAMAKAVVEPRVKVNEKTQGR